MSPFGSPEAGYVVAAPDVFWRFAPGWQAGHDQAGLEASIAKVQELDGPKAIADCAAALGVLRELPETTGQTAVLGFCMGGSLAWGVAAAAEPDVCVSYYGSQVPDMLDLIDRVSCPTLFHFGNTDAYLPGEGVERLAKAIEGRSSSRSMSRTPVTRSTITWRRCSLRSRRRSRPGRRRWPSSRPTSPDGPRSSTTTSWVRRHSEAEAASSAGDDERLAPRVEAPEITRKGWRLPSSRERRDRDVRTPPASPPGLVACGRSCPAG